MVDPTTLIQPTPTSTLSFNIKVPSFGNGFVNIAVLTTLIGPATAETMILGNHGAAGLAWATMSAFGVGRVIAVCASGACTPWLREMLGLRSQVVDSSLGMELSSNINSKIASFIKSRYAPDGPLGLSVDSRKVADGKPTWTEIYAFDDQTSRLIKSIPEAGPSSFGIPAYKECSANDKSFVSSSIRSEKSFSSSTDIISGQDVNLSVYTYAPYQFFNQHHLTFQLSMLGLSVLKFGECFTLWWLSGKPFLSIATALPWMYFFTVAVIVEINDLRNLRIPHDHDSFVDVISGQLPKMTHTGAGGARKIILGVSQNTRTAFRWKIMWAMSIIIYVPSFILTYMILSYESNRILFLWFFFQALWTFLRIIVHHFAEPMKNTSNERILAERPWSTLPSPLKLRVVQLMSALASYLTSVHPRRETAYRTAVVGHEELRTIIFHSSSRLYYPLPQDITTPFSARKKTIIEIEISSVIGDPTLSSAAWIAGAQHLTPTDLYDCCIISFRTYASKSDPMPTLISVPCARVLSGFPVFSKLWRQIDEEITHLPGPRQFVPKYAPNSGGNWCYFIPSSEPGLWLFFKHNITLDVVGKHTAEALTDMQVTGMLAEGDMNISLSHVDDVKQIVSFSEQARQILLQILVP